MKYFFVSLSLLLMGASCSSSHITSSWKSEKAVAKPYRKIMVLGLVGDTDRAIREKMEEHLAGDLKDLGYNTVTSASEYGSRAFENMKEEEAVKKLQDKGIDAVITVVLLDKTKESYYIPARPRHHIYTDQPGRFWNYYSSMYGRVYSPGYYGTSTKYFWESNFYDLNGGELLYSAQSRSFDPDSPGQLGHEYGLMIVKDMVKKKILQQPAPPTYKPF